MGEKKERMKKKKKITKNLNVYLKNVNHVIRVLNKHLTMSSTQLVQQKK